MGQRLRWGGESHVGGRGYRVTTPHHVPPHVTGWGGGCAAGPGVVGKGLVREDGGAAWKIALGGMVSCCGLVLECAWGAFPMRGPGFEHAAHVLGVWVDRC